MANSPVKVIATVMKAPVRHIAVLAVLGASALTSCQQQTTTNLATGAQDNEPVHSTLPDPDLSVQNPSAALKTMIAARAGCNTSADCASGVGLVVVGNPDNTTVSQCSGFLVAPDVIATSMDCLPEDLQEENASCTGRLRMAFPTSDGNSINVGCDQILSVAPESSSLYQQRYAFVKLWNPVYHDFYHLTHDGMTGKPANFSLIAVDATQNPPMVRSTSCPSVPNSALLLGNGTPSSPVFSFGCLGAKENAGGMIVGNSKNARGIWYGPISQDPVHQIETVFTHHAAQTRLSWVGNLACIQTPIDPAQFYFSSDCDATVDPSQLANQLLSVKSAFVSKYSGQADTQLNQWVQSNSTVFQQWQILSMNNELFAAPQCFSRSDENGWLKAYKKFLGIYSSSAVLKMSIPTWNVDLMLDDVMTISGTVTQQGDVSAQLTFSPAEFNNTSQSSVLMSVDTGQGNAPISSKLGQISVCP